MPDLAMLADNPFLRGNPASALTPEQKRDGLSGQPWTAGVAPGLEAAANAVGADQNRMFQKRRAEANAATREGYEQQRDGRVENG